MRKRITITADIDGGDDPTLRLLALEAVTREICIAVGCDKAEGIMMLLTAAARIWLAGAKDPTRAPEALAAALSGALLSVTAPQPAVRAPLPS